jgi:CDP-4-dehydro-6-deoxyglucose reductase, E1
MTEWRAAIEAAWNARQSRKADGPLFPLMNQGFGTDEIVAAVESLLTGQITMGSRVREFERRFAEFIGAPFAVMVNSGSSANLLAMSAAANPARARCLRPGDEVLVPAVCWSTSVWPILQCGLRPVFVDVDPATLNMSLDDLQRRITPHTRAILAVHVLGNSCPTGTLLDLVRQHDLTLIEDTCESLGSLANGRRLGTLGAFGTFSFYYSHHITTGEGGMVVCHSQEDADLLRSLRAHGWTRELSNRTAVESQHRDVDPRFNFVNTGFNFRPLEVQAAFGIVQLAKLEAMNAERNRNRTRLIAGMKAHPAWKDQYAFTNAAAGTAPTWFGFTLLRTDERDLRSLLDALSARGVENRPIISGNFARQPALTLLGLNVDPRAYPGAETIHQQGFFIGVHSESVGDDLMAKLADALMTA